MTNIIIYSKNDCPWCDKAKELLTKKSLAFHEKKFGIDFTKEELRNIVGNPEKVTVPQIFIDNQLIGGYTDLVKYFDERNL